MPATKIVHINLIGAAEKLAKLSDAELFEAERNVLQLCIDIMTDEAILAPNTPSGALYALSMMTVNEAQRRGLSGPYGL